jgi:hypothetical protein
MILFGLITILEDTGYMARISFLSDKLMRKVGLNGKSVMPMISGFACAVPAIMSARNIENKKERLLTIMITPLMSCSARLPVYTILIALVIPSKLYFGFLSLQGLVMMALYLLGTVMALIVAWVMKWFIKSTERSFFILELPTYRAPRWKNALTTMIEKARIFVFDAGKVIMMISLLLWALSSFGPPGKMDGVKTKYAELAKNDASRATLYERLEESGNLSLFPSNYLSQRWLGQSRMFEEAIDDEDDPEGVEFVSEKEIEQLGVKKRIYVFKIMYDKEDESTHYLGIVGPYPADKKDLRNAHTYTSVNWDENFDKKGVERQVEKLLKQREEEMKDQ